MCENCGLLEDVAALTGTEAHHTVDVPGAVSILAIQGAARVSLREVAHTNTSCRLACVWEFRGFLSNILSACFKIRQGTLQDSVTITANGSGAKSQDPFFGSTHITPCSDAVTSGTDHLVCGQDAPPVGLRADVVADHRQESLLQNVW